MLHTSVLSEELAEKINSGHSIHLLLTYPFRAPEIYGLEYHFGCNKPQGKGEMINYRNPVENGRNNT